MAITSIYAKYAGFWLVKDSVDPPTIARTNVTDGNGTLTTGRHSDGLSYNAAYYSWRGQNFSSIGPVDSVRMYIGGCTGSGGHNHPINRLSSSPTISSASNSLPSYYAGTIGVKTSGFSESDLWTNAWGEYYRDNPTQAWGVIIDQTEPRNTTQHQLPGFNSCYLRYVHSLNTAPTITPSTPTNMELPTTGAPVTPFLSAYVTDPDADGMSVTFEVDTSSAFNTVNKQTYTDNLWGPVSSDLRSVYVDSPGLSVGYWYWRARVYDGTAYSSWTVTRVIRVVQRSLRIGGDQVHTARIGTLSPNAIYLGDELVWTP